uniref:Uncharacterized protein n=1 Tax=Anguilla anguilla TaxID=7936 RepID=A0A0E9TM40_ANGAN
MLHCCCCPIMLLIIIASLDRGWCLCVSQQNICVLRKPKCSIRVYTCLF